MRVANIIIIWSFSAFCVSGQQPVAEPNQTEVPPVVTQEQREKQIRMYDPLDKSTSGSNERKPANEARQDPDAANTTGSANKGPQVLSDESDTPVQEYNGPAVLSRSYTISRPTMPKQVRWSPTVGFAESYDSGLLGGPVTPGGPPAVISGFGYALNWGIAGRHYWKHDQIGLDYRGSQQKYVGLTGTNQTLNADYEHQLSRRLMFNIVTSASILSQNYGFQIPGVGLGEASLANLNLNASPTVQITDLGTRQLSNQASVTWHKSARLSFTASGGIFFVQRTGGLFGNTGYQSQADVNYRFTRKTTVGAYYSYTNYVFSHRVNVANLHTVGGIYSYALGRSTQIRLRGGITRIETEGLQTVAIDPVIALLLGQTSAVVEGYHLNSTSDVSSEIVRDFGRRGTASVSYVRGVSPGNGLLLTSVQEAFSGTFTYKPTRKYSLMVTVSQSTLSSAAQNDVGNYNIDSFTIDLTRPVSHHLIADFRLEYRTFDITSQPLLHHQLRITTGLSWNPGENWFKSW